MKNKNQSNFISTKRIKSLGNKLQRSESKNSLSQQNDHSDISTVSKYFHQVEKEEYHPDQTDRFLTQTKNKLYSSSQRLHKFHKNKQQYKFTNQNLNFSIVNKQLKCTKQKILTKNFAKLPKNTYQKHQLTNLTTTQRYDEYELNKKCILVQKVLSEKEFQSFKTQLTKKIQDLKIEYNDDQIMRDKVIKYFINHQIISKFLQQTAKDTTKLILRKQNFILYHQMKDQMVSLLSNQEHFYHHIQQIYQQEQIRFKSILKRTPQNQSKLTKIHIKPKCSANYEKPLLQKIQDLLQASKNNIKEAFINFGKSSKSDQIQLQFNKKLSNNFILQ